MDGLNPVSRPVDETPATAAGKQGFVDALRNDPDVTRRIALELLRQAREAGLRVAADGEQLRIKGPQKAQAIARRILEHKDAVLASLLECSPAPSVDVTETPKTLEKDGGFVDGGGPISPRGAESAAVSPVIPRARAVAQRAWERALGQMAEAWDKLAQHSKRAGVEPPVLDPQVDSELQAEVCAAILEAETTEGALRVRTAIARWRRAWLDIEVPDAIVEAARRPAPAKKRRKRSRKPAPIPASWSPAAEEAIAWFQTQPATLPTTPFDLHPWARVTNVEAFLNLLRAETAGGPGGIRSRALEAEVVRLHELFGPATPDSPGSNP